ncbi:hypothetical protein ATEIFO6365_0002038900 [Aspergillus terreus]|uniref:Uncharacterized protein n=1 Tax=Aspergillus terreus TaxID=33178 RepID=A0A5M3YVP9_ASPTE|nr:hypothetical protein ATETN484_0004038900 [Aspergillus terreus]GFF13279.1 hypothetical protein ATEIFO6365_0002038900 [Aspergillus terreus]
MKLAILVATLLAAVAVAIPTVQENHNAEHEVTADGNFKKTTNGWAYQQKRDANEGATADYTWKMTSRGTWGG